MGKFFIHQIFPVRPEPVQACPERLLQAGSRRGPFFFEKGQGFDKLSPNG
jgi:2-oxoisovalerate dehydrogenase E2 component (dihydrolipoyl transacylase)